jgi:hypothetical protein
MSAEAYNVKFFSSDLGKETTGLFLSMALSNATFSYSISNDGFNTVRELCHVEMTPIAQSSMDLASRLSSLVNNYLLNQKKFAGVNICMLNQDFTLLPEAYSEQGADRDLLTFTAGVQSQSKPLQHTLQSMKFSYAIEPDLLSYFERVFPTASLRHAGAVNISLFFSQFSLQPADVLLHVSDGLIELAAKQKNALLMYNVFQYAVTEDILYYLLFMMEQLSFNPLTCRLVVTGEVDAASDLMKSLKRYVKEVNFGVRDESLQLHGDLAKIPGHYYFTLLNQHLCAL